MKPRMILFLRRTLAPAKERGLLWKKEWISKIKNTHAPPTEVGSSLFTICKQTARATFCSSAICHFLQPVAANTIGRTCTYLETIWFVTPNISTYTYTHPANLPNIFDNCELQILLKKSIILHNKFSIQLYESRTLSWVTFLKRMFPVRI